MNEQLQRDEARDGRPLVRWWWFANEIVPEDIARQVQWFTDHGFGGVEIAWVYPWPPGEVTDDTPPPFLSPAWEAAVATAISECWKSGLSVDLTYGTLWPFGGTFVGESWASQRWDGPSDQRLNRSWEAAPGRIMNHLDRTALAHYDDHVGASLARAIADARSRLAKANEPREEPDANPASSTGQDLLSHATSGTAPIAFFADSWEVNPDRLWSVPLGRRVHDWYGWDVTSPPASVETDPVERYRYREALAETVLDEFYQSFAAHSRSHNALSRVQAHGAPTDLLRAYGSSDIPESEAVLFDPSFSQIAASAALLHERSLVSAEAFTCLYGWTRYPGPGAHQGEEYPNDVYLTALALFAHGVNQIIWHGAPYQTSTEARSFYASVHVAPDGALAPHLEKLNATMTHLANAMRRGRPATDIGVYLPIEDRWMADTLPEELRRPSAQYEWEHHYDRLPAVLNGYQPTWISGFMLEEAASAAGTAKLTIGNNQFDALVLFGVHYISVRGALALIRLCEHGVPVLTTNLPQIVGGRTSDPPREELEANLYRVLREPYDEEAILLKLAKTRPPYVLHDGSSTPLVRIRVEPQRNTYLLAPPEAADISYPLHYRQSDVSAPHHYRVRLMAPSGRYTPLEVHVAPLEALLVEVYGDDTLRVTRILPPRSSD